MRDAQIEEFIERVRNATDILSVVQSYVTLKKKGNRYWGCCPFHNENTPSFSVVPDKGFFYCFGCQTGGDVLKFLSLISNTTYYEATKNQADRLGISQPNRDKNELARFQEIDEIKKVNELAKDFFHNCLVITNYGLEGKEYLYNRGINDELIQEFSLGFAPNFWTKLTDSFIKRGVTHKLLLDSGLAFSRKDNTLYDRFRNRVIIPISDDNGRIVGFGGRAIGDEQPKYLNTSETNVFNKRKLLFALDKSKRAIGSEGYALIVEGYMDAISLFGAGIKNVVATLGTAFTSEQARKIRKYTQKIVFCYDNDEAGQIATIRALAVLRGTGLELSVVVVPQGKDPDDYIRCYGVRKFRELLKQSLPVIDYHINYALQHNNLCTLEGRLSALKSLLPVLYEYDKESISEYRKRISKLLLVDEEYIVEAIAEYKKNQYTSDTDKKNLHKINESDKNISIQNYMALQFATRNIIRAICISPDLLAQFESMLPIEEIDDALHREILLGIKKYIKEFLHNGNNLINNIINIPLSLEANNELLIAIDGECANNQRNSESNYKLDMDNYMDALNTIRKSHLVSKLSKYSRIAEQMLIDGNEQYIEALNEVKKIQSEINKL